MNKPEMGAGKDDTIKLQKLENKTKLQHSAAALLSVSVSTRGAMSAQALLLPHSFSHCGFISCTPQKEKKKPLVKTCDREAVNG